MNPSLRPLVTQAAPRLRTLADRLEAAKTRLHRIGCLTAFPYQWQVPAATEKAAYEAVVAGGRDRTFEYWGFPWATVIDGLRGESPSTWQVLGALREAIGDSPRPAAGVRRVSVAQHIHALQFIELFQAAGVTDLFWSHAAHGQDEVGGIRLHAFPLFPAQTPCALPPEQPVTNRKHLANFIGAFNPKVYLTNVREVIFGDAGSHGDLLIVRRQSWHFDRAVYEEQIKGLRPDQQRLHIEERMTQEYLAAIQDSWFTLCPSGSGPNSIRIFESLCLGSIPIILTRALRLAGPAALWEAAAVIDDDSEDGYRRALARARAMPRAERLAMLAQGRELAQRMAPAVWGSLMDSGLAATNSS